jgi:8-oxo-dGTP pyrophosphatase MutT (NUDIX family)
VTDPASQRASPPVAPSERAPARDAATVVLLRPAGDGPEVLLTRRPSTMRFGPDLHVFPGGRVEPGEDALAAAVRETLEETGIELDPRSLAPVGRWVTPFNLPIRFDARFFAAFVEASTDILVASDEVVDARWIRPTDALLAMRSGELSMWQPTVVTLQHLEAVRTRQDLERATAPGPVAPPAMPDRAPGVRRFPTAWAGALEGRAGETGVVGDREWLAVDPADPTGESADAILDAAAASGATLAGVLVTSLEPERHAGVELFATGLGLPVAGPPGSSGLVPYRIQELGSGPVPFGDVALVVEAISPPSGEAAGDDGAGLRWADRAGRLRLRVAGVAEP